jgi:hypothetical protein
MVKIKQNDTEQTIAVPSAVSIGVNGWDTSIKKSTNGVENRAFTLARNALLSDNQYNSYTANSINNTKLSLVDDNYTPLQKDDILNNVTIPDSNTESELHTLNARTVGLTKAYTAESPVSINNNRIVDANNFDYPSGYIPNEDDSSPANIVYTKAVSGYRSATVSGYDISAEDLEGDYVEQASYTGFITTINANLLFSHSSSGNYLTFTQGDLDQDVEPFTGRLCVTRQGTLTEIDATWVLPYFGVVDASTYNSSGDYVADVWNGRQKTSNGNVLTSTGTLTTSTLPVEIMLLSDGRWLLLPNQVIATGNIYDSTTGNIYGAFTVFSDLSWIANWYWKPTQNPSDNLVYADPAPIRNTSNNYMSITQTPFGQTTSYQAASGSGGSIYSEKNRTMDTSSQSSLVGLRALSWQNYSWCQNNYTRGYFMQVRSV